MSASPSTPRILHQKETVAVVKSVLSDSFAENSADPIDNPTSPGATYNQEEMESQKQAIDAILEVLRSSGFVATDVVVGPATFDSIEPIEGPPGTEVVVSGSGFTGATALGFWYSENGVYWDADDFVVISDTEIHATTNFQEGISTPIAIRIGFADTSRNIEVPGAFKLSAP